MKQIVFFLLFISTVLFINSCCKTEPCEGYGNGNYKPLTSMTIEFYAHSLDEFDSTSYIVYYPKNTNFSNPVDTFFFKNNDMHRGSMIQDSIARVSIIIYNDSFKTQYDWDIVIKKSIHYKVTDFEFIKLDCKECPWSTDPGDSESEEELISYRVNGIKKEQGSIEIEK